MVNSRTLGSSVLQVSDEDEHQHVGSTHHVQGAGEHSQEAKVLRPGRRAADANGAAVVAGAG